MCLVLNIYYIGVLLVILEILQVFTDNDFASYLMYLMNDILTHWLYINSLYW